MGSVIKEEQKMKGIQKNSKPETKGYGNKLGYSIFHFVLKNIGLYGAYGILLLLTPYYVIFRPSVYQCSKYYLQRRFPRDNFCKRYLRLFKYIYTFGQALIDQLYYGFVDESKFELVFHREPEILDLLNQKPVIFLMSHVGFWEVSMAGSARFNKTLNVMVNKDFDKDKRKSFYDIKGKKFNLINVSDDYGGMVEATGALLRGEALGVTGDRAEGWRSKRVSFLGAPAKFPTIAQQLAVATGASVIALFTSKKGRYQILIDWKDISTEVLADEKLSKDEKIESMLHNYADALEKHIQNHPYLWFNFFDFWKR
ncbi:MAG: lysophospholipid acyltransferase family protein [Firmicutes bacterium]|nr:lysophospholipid acyltransferase family protein [Bacillota bacterium]